MITKEMLVRWREAVTLAISSPTPEPAITIAMQEMYIEAKGLRRDNLMLLNSENLIELMWRYINISSTEHYVDEEMEELLVKIEKLSKHININLELIQ